MSLKSFLFGDENEQLKKAQKMAQERTTQLEGLARPGAAYATGRTAADIEAELNALDAAPIAPDFNQAESREMIRLGNAQGRMDENLRLRKMEELRQRSIDRRRAAGALETQDADRARKQSELRDALVAARAAEAQQGVSTQLQGLAGQFQDVYAAGGMTPQLMQAFNQQEGLFRGADAQAEAERHRNLTAMADYERAQRDATMRDLAARGAGGSGAAIVGSLGATQEAGRRGAQAFRDTEAERQMSRYASADRYRQSASDAAARAQNALYGTGETLGAVNQIQAQLGAQTRADQQARYGLEQDLINQRYNPQIQLQQQMAPSGGLWGDYIAPIANSAAASAEAYNKAKASFGGGAADVPGAA